MTQCDDLLGRGSTRASCDCQNEASRRFAGIFDRLADGFFSLDADWRFTYVNPAARTALRAGDEVLGQVIWDVYPEARETIFEVEFRRSMDTGATTEFEAFYPELRIWLRLNAFPFDQGLAVSVADITESRQARLQLAHLNRELRRRVQAHREVESFAHTVAHDLRSPLGAILGFSEALSECAVGELGPRGSHYLHRIQTAARQMDVMTKAIMTLCGLAQAEMSRTSVDLGQIAHECIAILRDAEPRRNVQCSVAPAMWAQCDAGLMRVALHNLLSNAWKFSGRKVEPHIEVGTEPGPGGQVWYFVRDNGIGFDPSEAHRLFEPFQRLHGDSFSGEGIGLATVKRIIDRHRGSLRVVSQPGKGSTFYFTLPPDTISS